ASRATFFIVNRVYPSRARHRMVVRTICSRRTGHMPILGLTSPSQVFDWASNYVRRRRIGQVDEPGPASGPATTRTKSASGATALGGALGFQPLERPLRGSRGRHTG